MQLLAISRVYLNMDVNSKTDNLNGTTHISLKRFTPSELRERLLYEQEARIKELIQHNAELVKAMEHEREQSRLHAEANAKALMLLEETVKQRSTSPSSSPTISSITSAAGNLIALAVISGYSFVPGIIKFLSTSEYPELTVMLRTEWGVQGVLLVSYFAWTLGANRTSKQREYVHKAAFGTVWLITFIYQCLGAYLTYRYHSSNTVWTGDLLTIIFAVASCYVTYSNWRLAWKLWKENKKPISQSTDQKEHKP